MLKQVVIERFKSIEKIILPLEKINILVGANNSGKSSILQAIQFSISVAQTIKVAPWSYNELRRTFSPTQLVYAPLRDVTALAYNGKFLEADGYKMHVGFMQDNGEK